MSYMSTGLDFFSIGVDFFDSDCMVIMGTKYGSRSLLLAVRLQSKIYGEGYFYHWGEDELLLFTHRMGADYTADYVRQVVQALVERGFFDKEKYEAYGILTSVAIQSLYFEAVQRRKVVEVEPAYLLVDVAKYKNICKKGEKRVVDTPEESGAHAGNRGDNGRNVCISTEKAVICTENADISAQKKREETEKKSPSSKSSPEGVPGGELSEEEILHSIPQDGVKRNCRGLIESLRQYGVKPEDIAKLVKYCNYGVIGHPVWQAVADIRNSGGKIKQPLKFIWSRLRQGAT